MRNPLVCTMHRSTLNHSHVCSLWNMKTYCSSAIRMYCSISRVFYTKILCALNSHIIFMVFRWFSRAKVFHWEFVEVSGLSDPLIAFSLCVSESNGGEWKRAQNYCGLLKNCCTTAFVF